MKKKLIDYCNENWNLPRYELDKSLDIMDNDRCPLAMANERVANHLINLIGDFVIDNDLDGDWFYDNFDDIEELFWELDIFD